MERHKVLIDRLTSLKFSITEMEKKYGADDEYVGGQTFIYTEIVKQLEESSIISADEKELLELEEKL